MDIRALEVNRTVDAKDGMSNDNADYYFMTGRNALTSVVQALGAAQKPESEVKRVLDYACGYGRVLRWLMAGFPDAKVIGVDTDKAAVASAQKTLGADTRVLDPGLGAKLDDPVDLIWVGSLFTHLDRAYAEKVLAFLRSHLTPEGVLVFTTHGHLVERRLRNRERDYGLDEPGVARLIEEYDGSGYGFAPYGWTDSYGISANAPAVMMEMIEAAGMDPVHFRASGWVKHQDVFGAIPAG